VNSRGPILVFLPGLGANEKLFSLIRPLLPFESICPRLPLDLIGEDRIESLAEALVAELKVLGQKEFIFVGFSFGGQLAWELSRSLSPKGIILLSSFKSHNEILPRFRRQVSLSRWIPSGLLLFLIRSFGVRLFCRLDQLNSSQAQILKEMVSELHASDFRRSCEMAVGWRGDYRLSSIPCLEIFGEGDRVVPVPSSRTVQIVPKGGHLVLLKQPQAVAGEIEKWIKKFG
jgi:pimeloyl-ACP methyl ester carboxylesterase